jgi:methylation protein EvaC
MKCKITDKPIKPFMSFGKMPIANGFLEKQDFSKEYFYNMEVGFSEDISLLQLNDHPKPEVMFNENYPFFTSSSKHMIEHFKSYANFVRKYLNTNSKLIEIGSNDGTFLKNFSNNSNNIIGFEPSKNVAELAQKNKVPTINSFFNTKTIANINEYLGNTDLICASNVICHIPDLNDLIKSVDMLLSLDGTFVFEEPYLGSMFDQVSYDQIYDEHIYVFSVSSVSKIFERFNLYLVDAIPQKTHGGSMRYVVKRKNDKSSQIKKIIEEEKIKKLDQIESCLMFKNNCEISKKRIVDKINILKNQGKSICGYAATSKSTTILNYCQIGCDQIDYICDTTSEKIGKFSPGMHIPIKDMDYFRKNQTDCIYLFAWNHKLEILNKEKNFKGYWFSHVEL